MLKYALFYMLIFVAIGLINFLKGILLVVVSQGVGKKIRLEMLNKINRMSFVIFSKYDSGDLEAYFSNDVDEINTLITSGVISMLIDSFKMIGIIVSIFIFSYMFGIITLAIIPFIVLFTMWIRKRMYKAQLSNRKLEGSVNNLVLENIDNIVTIKTFRIYDKVNAKYDEVLKNHFKTNQKANTYDALFSPVMQIIKTILIVLIITLSTANMNLFGMSVGMLVSSIDLITNLLSPIENLGMELQTIQKSLAAIQRINEFFKLEDDDKKNKQMIGNYNDLELVFDNVSFAYDNSENVIDHFNYTIHQNNRLVLKGRSGSGKSTLLHMLGGLDRPTEGKVFVDGKDIFALKDEELTIFRRRKIGFVFQAYNLVPVLNVYENIVLPVELDGNKVDKTFMNEVVQMLGLEDKLNNMPNNLSGGQQQRVAIARALVSKPSIVLADEPTGNLDSKTSADVLGLLKTTSQKFHQTIVMITHNNEIAQLADRIIRIEDGKIVQ